MVFIESKMNKKASNLVRNFFMWLNFYFVSLGYLNDV